jgi:hypothetical protein
MTNVTTTHRRRAWRRTRRDDGFAIPMTALVLIPMLIVAAFAVDVGGWYAQTSRMQRAADAAALAGVVWMPNQSKAETVARDTAERNGFKHDPTGTGVTVSVSSPGEAKLRVVISAPGDVYLGRLVNDSVSFTRDAVAEYVLSVPLGSPRNYFGTGTLDTNPSGNDENLYLANSTWCTDKVDGDRFQSRYFGNRPYSDENCPSPPPGSSSLLNTEYRPNGYEYYVEVPASRTGPIEVRLYDARYSPGSGSPDSNLYSGPQTYTFTMFSADDTPLDDSNNPIMNGTGGQPNCTRTFTASSAFDSYTYLGATRWNTLCTITTAMPAGRYIVRVQNNPGQQFGAGSNSFAIVAKYQSATPGLCDGRTDSTCPRVFGKDSISVFASQSSSTADFYLAEISPLHAGKQLQITLFDPGEGGNNIRIRRPTGTNSWTDASFTWESSNGTSGSGTSLDVTGSVFNGHSVTVTVSLSGYSPPADNRWWQIRYNFGSGSVTDRTTWQVVILGDPVHLVE